MICWKCKKEIDVSEIFRTTECPLCHSQLHVCKGCKFYAPGNHYDCKETVEDNVTDKEVSNFCDSFSYGVKTGNAPDKKSDDARNAFNALFGD